MSIKSTDMDGVRKRLQEFGATLMSEDLLRKALEDRNVKFDYMCIHGHLNHKTVSCFRQYSICRVCSGCDPEQAKQRFLFKVEDRGGLVDAEKYKNSKTKIEIICHEGHSWESTPNSILRETWCPQCANRSIDQTLERLVAKVEERLGKFNPAMFKTANTKLRFTCHHEHVWDTKPLSILDGRWCPRCANRSTDQARERLLSKVESHKGKVDMTTYLNVNKKCSFECEKGHTWETTPRSVLNGSWCRTCSYKGR